MESINATTTTLPVLVGTIGVGLITTAVVVVLSRSFLTNKQKNNGSTKTNGVSSVGNNNPKASAQQHSSTTKNLTTTSNASTNNSISSKTTTTTNDVWEERRQRGIPAASLHIKKDIDNKGVKPFGSSYYYAHNSTKTTGGYKDGLTMEDYTMNGPRLLSRNGTPVIDNYSQETLTQESVQQQQQDEKLDSMVESVQSENNSSLMNKRNGAVTTATRIIHVTKYLWDDPGNTKDGIATLRIDTVPSYHKKGNTQCDDTIPWKDIRPYIQTITASILPNDTTKKGDTNGLYVKIEVSIPSNINDNSIMAPNDVSNSSNNGMNYIDYVLKISKLYGRVQNVEYKNKEKRLLIQLYKYSTLLDKSNLRAWPYPQQKLII